MVIAPVTVLILAVCVCESLLIFLIGTMQLAITSHHKWN